MKRFEHGGDIYEKPGIILDFSVNINPFGMPEEVCRALVSRVDEFAHYPDPQCRALRAAISRHEGVPADWILCGNGAADLIYRLCYAARPHRALVLAPTFSEYERALEQVGCEITYYALTAKNQFALTAEVIESMTPDLDLLFLCNPNNPTGRFIQKGVLECVLDRAMENCTTIVMDECFLDFTNGGISCKGYLAKMPKLVILKAFTKMYAMAGLRLGYLLSSDTELLKKTSAAAQCWSVSIPAQIAGTAALSCMGWEEKTRRIITAERKFLSDALSELGVKVFPSDANYILLHNKLPLYEPLLKRGILIRSCENFKGLGAEYCRIGVKLRNDNMRLIQACKEIIHA